MGVDIPERVCGVVVADSSSSSGDTDFRLLGVTVPDEETFARCLFSRNERISLSKIDW